MCILKDLFIYRLLSEEEEKETQAMSLCKKYLHLAPDRASQLVTRTITGSRASEKGEDRVVQFGGFREVAGKFSMPSRPAEFYQ